MGKAAFPLHERGEGRDPFHAAVAAFPDQIGDFLHREAGLVEHRADLERVGPDVQERREVGNRERRDLVGLQLVDEFDFILEVGAE